MKALRPVRAFTLIELLTVLAITAVLMTLIVVPVVQSFNLTRAAQGFTEAQERGRNLIERIAQEIANSSAPSDNTGLKGSIGIVLPGQNGQPVELLMEYTKLDIVKPAQGEPERGPSGAFIDPTTGKEDPTRVVPGGQVVLPAAPGASYVRYFVGLSDPMDGNPNAFTPKSYNNPYDGLLVARNGQRDNLYVLYRVEFEPHVWDQNLGRFVVNPQLFTDLDNDNVPDQIDDPFFFTFRPASAGANADLDGAGALINDPVRGQGKALRMANWLRRAVIMTEVSRYDMIQTIFHKGTRQVTYVNNVPQIIPLIQFRPTRLTSEPAAGLAAVRPGEEAENMEAFAPDVFTTRYGAWVNVILRTWPSGYAQDLPASNSYLVGRIDPADGDFKIFAYDPDTGPSDVAGGVPLFNVSLYGRLIRSGAPHPFTSSLHAGNMSIQANRDLFVAYHHEPRSGRIFSGYYVTEIGTGPQSSPNEPQQLTTDPAGPIPQTPVSDPGAQTMTLPQVSPYINRLFNWTWLNYDGGTPGLPNLQPNIHRFINLRMVANDGPSPLNPDPAIGFPRAKIVPNSEVVIGPDQNPGPNLGNPIRYSRTTRTPGPNQYRINYVNLPEPDYALLGLPNPPATYDPNNFMSVAYQPRFKAGYIQLNSDPNIALPNGVIRVNYKFQMTHPKDVFAVDYDTRQLMSVLLTVRNYPGTSLPNPQSITLKANAKVRNFLR